jgi:hypothetical protein
MRMKLTNKSLWISRLLLAMGMLCVLLFAGVASAKTTYAASSRMTYDTDPVRTAVDIAKPAVVRIFTGVTGHLTVRLPTGDVTFPQGGKAYQLEFSGSGTFISAHGDILTADHVVSPPDMVLQDAAAAEVATYMNQHNLPGTPVTADQVRQALFSGQISSQATFDSKTSEVFLSTAYTGPLSADTLQGIPSALHATVDRIEKESAVNEADVAIIHVPLTDMPSVQLGDSSTVQTQDQLTIIGFPGNGDVSSKPTNVLTSSVNTITVSSIKTTDTGAPVIQVGGNVEHGDSGGPALDSHGTVVGIVSFGLADTPGGTSFLQASNSARALVQQLNLDTTPGSFQKQWSQAYTDYTATTPGHWHKAAQELAQLANAYPSFKAVTPYLSDAQTQAKTESVPQSQLTPGATPTSNRAPNTSTATTISALAATVAALAAILLLLILFFTVAFRRREQKKTPASMVSKGAQSQARPSPAQQLPLSRVGNSGAAPQSRPSVSSPDYNAGMTAFGAPPNPSQQSPTMPRWPASQPAGPSGPAVPPVATSTSGVLRPWPCGHMNRSNARFCSICGEPAPPPPTRGQ